MVTICNQVRGAVLRDFYLASNPEEMIDAFKASDLAIPNDKEYWKEIEYAFNRLFIGPRTVIAPPFASAYLETEGYLMGETTRYVRNFYHTIGLISPWEGQLPDDHISLELDACLQIRKAIDETGYSQLQPVYEHFLRDHMMKWIPQFIERIQAETNLPDFLSQISEQLQLWLKNETEWLAEQSVITLTNNFCKERGGIFYE